MQLTQSLLYISLSTLIISMNSIVFEESIDRFFADTENISYNDLNCLVNLKSD